MIKNTTFVKLALFISSGETKQASHLGQLERTNLNPCPVMVSSMAETFRNVLCFKFKLIDEGKYPRIRINFITNRHKNPLVLTKILLNKI